jgi:RES domain-containing protein
MRLWRLSSLRRARDFNGGYGLAGRWNTPGRPVNVCVWVSCEAQSVGRLANDMVCTGTSSGTLGDGWLDEATALLLVVPSVIIPIAAAPNRNILINHRRAHSGRITIAAITPFTFDPRLFRL